MAGRHITSCTGTRSGQAAAPPPPGRRTVATSPSDQTTPRPARRNGGLRTTPADDGSRRPLDRRKRDRLRFRSADEDGPRTSDRPWATFVVRPSRAAASSSWPTPPCAAPPGGARTGRRTGRQRPAQTQNEPPSTSTQAEPSRVSPALRPATVAGLGQRFG